VPGAEHVVTAGVSERGSYFCFDAATFEKHRRDNFVLSYDELEGVPSLPPS
jgi:hypothetical protein